MAILGALALTGMMVPSALAAMCPREQLDAAVDGAGETLRKLKDDMAPRIRQKMRDLMTARGWKEADYEEQAYLAAQDKRLGDFDLATAQLFQKVDRLGATGETSKEVDCAAVAEATAASVELQATVRARTQYLISRLETLAAADKASAAASSAAASTAAAPAATAPATQPAPQKSATAPATQSAPQKSAAVVTPLPPPAPAAAAPPAIPNAPSAAQSGGWGAAVNKNETPTAGAASGAASGAPPAAAAAPEYNIDEIAGAARGIFGKASANLAKVLEHAFATAGRPTGYIIGSETGAVIIAGVRYGKGTLVMRSGEEVTVYWHGPSIGAEFGASESQVLFLVYKLAAANDIFATFTGVEGSAYVVGGLGLNYLSNGHVQMAPIRTGVGLRFGASIGYAKFTRRKTWNPF